MRHLEDTALNALLDDELTPAERTDAEAHVARCDTCAAELAGLRALTADLGSLPRGVLPARDLLAGIHAAINGASVIPFRPQSPGQDSERPARRTALSQRTLRSARWSLAAAAVALVAISSAVTALMLRAPAAEPAFVAADAVTFVPPVELDRVEARFISATGELERVLEQEQANLSPETVRILEESLAIIDAALAEARTALHADPGNAALSEILLATYEKKLDLLRRAAASVIT